MKRLVLACIFIAAITTQTFAADASKVTVAPVITTDTTATGQPIVMPEHPELVVTIVTFPPGSRLSVHKHLYPHYGYMLQGELTVVNQETGKSTVLKQGDFLVEVNNTWHYGQNNGKDPVRLLVIDHLPRGVTSNVVMKNTK
jgi:quercetin dioxygenase-like cupin family protein